MMRQRQIARQLERPLAKLLVFLLLLMQSLLSLLSQCFGSMPLFGKSAVLQLEFSVLFGEPFGAGTLRVATPKQIPCGFIPSRLVLTDGFGE
jgi:hypothetical protein